MSPPPSDFANNSFPSSASSSASTPSCFINLNDKPIPTICASRPETHPTSSPLSPLSLVTTTKLIGAGCPTCNFISLLDKTCRSELLHLLPRLQSHHPFSSSSPVSHPRQQCIYAAPPLRSSPRHDISFSWSVLSSAHLSNSVALATPPTSSESAQKLEICALFSAQIHLQEQVQVCNGKLVCYFATSQRFSASLCQHQAQDDQTLQLFSHYNSATVNKSNGTRSAQGSIDIELTKQRSNNINND